MDGTEIAVQAKSTKDVRKTAAQPAFETRSMALQFETASMAMPTLKEETP